MSITDWPASERPRERLLSLGAARLSDAELLAIFLRTGVPGRSALDIARDLLGSFGSLSRLLASEPARLQKTPGMGNAKTAQLLAAMELARRTLAEELAGGNALSSPQSVKDYLRLSLAGREHEVFVAMMLDAQHRVIACEEMFRGTLTQTSVYPREVVKRALELSASALIIVHNHPSGDPEPSATDIEMTRQVQDACQKLGLVLHDHLVIGRGRHTSFRARGLV